MTIENVKNSVELLTDFFNVLSDGYNPSLIYFNYFESSTNVEKEIFILPNHFGNDIEDRYYNSIIETKTNIENLNNRISENLKWCSEHLVCFNKAPSIFESKFHLDNFNNLVLKIENQIFNLIDEWVISDSKEYLVDTNDGSLRRVLIIKSKNKSIVLDFGNYIH